MDRGEKVILTNMCMVEDGEGRVLVQRRSDPNWPGIVFPGGHVEPGEAFGASVVREVEEETGLRVIHPVLCGVKQFWSKEGYRYIVLLYRANQYTGSLRSSDEGEAFWIRRDDLAAQRLAGDFDRMLPVFENEGLSEYFRDPSDNVMYL